MGVEDNKKTLLRLLQAIESSDRDAIEDAFLADARWRIPKGAPESVAGLHRGASHIADLMVGAMDGSFVDGSVDWRPGLILGEGDVVMLEANLRAAKPGGELYDNHYVFVAEFGPGTDRIAELREHVDTSYAARFFDV